MRTNPRFPFGKRRLLQVHLYFYCLVILGREGAASTEFKYPGAKVASKRMNISRIVVLTIALSTGVAAYLASGSDNGKPAPAESAAKLQTVEVLVAKSDNGRVDVILSKREKNAGNAGAPDIVNSEIIPSNIRVLAIDQAPKENDGQNAVVGKTRTLSLALRSIADVNIAENKTQEDQSPKRGESVNVVRHGIPSSTTTQK